MCTETSALYFHSQSTVKLELKNLTFEMNYEINWSQGKEYLQTGGGRDAEKSTQVSY